MAEGGVHDFGAFAVSLQEVGSDLGMAAFHVVIGGFADIVQQARAASERGIHAEFFRHHAGDECDFDRMPENVLAIAGAIVEAAEQIDDAFVEAADLGFLNGFLTVAANILIDFLLCFGDEFFDAGRVNAAIGDEFVERGPSNFAADGIESTDDYDARRVIDDHVDAGCFFEGANVAAFATDDAAFHFVAGDVDRAGRGLGGVGSGEALN